MAKSKNPDSIRQITRKLGLARSTFYYQPKQPLKDWHLKNQIEIALKQNPSYGHKRLALEIKVNKKRALRVMKLFGIKPYRRRGRKWRKTKVNGNVYPNLLQQMDFPKSTRQVWVSDFTHLGFHGKWIYLATIMDVFNRQIVGWSLLTSHAVQLTLGALIDALEKHGRPQIIHSDQGSEYKSKAYTGFVEQLGIKLSMSHKGSPWENGYQESFYSQFKVDLGDPNRFKTLGELAVAVYLQLYYYNNLRIHSKLKMPPVAYAAERQNNQILLTNTS